MYCLCFVIRVRKKSKIRNTNLLLHLSLLLLCFSLHFFPNFSLINDKGKGPKVQPFMSCYVMSVL